MPFGLDSGPCNIKRDGPTWQAPMKALRSGTLTAYGQKRLFKSFVNALTAQSNGRRQQSYRPEHFHSQFGTALNGNSGVHNRRIE